MSYKESDIKWEGSHFFVIWNRSTKRFEVCKFGACAADLVGWGADLAKVIKTARKLELYPNSI